MDLAQALSLASALPGFAHWLLARNMTFSLVAWIERILEMVLPMCIT